MFRGMDERKNHVAIHSGVRLKFGRDFSLAFRNVSIALSSCIALQYFLSNSFSFPEYLSFLLIVCIGILSFMWTSAQAYINWRALSTIMHIVVLISIIWEVTLAARYAWWGYQPKALIGIYITAWNHLPIEAVNVWLLVTFVCATLYEGLVSHSFAKYKHE